MAADVLVSARISQAKKDAAQSVLRSIGSTTSELINNAFDYVVANGRLPLREGGGARSREDFVKFIDESTLPIAWPADATDDYKAVFREGKRERYESLA